jgi:predicted dehydrogenase
MKQVVRRGLKEIAVEDVPAPVAGPHHVVVRPVASLISSGTETASIHPSVLRTLRHNPSQLRKIWDVMLQQGPVRTIDEVRAKFSDLAILGYSGAGIVESVHPSVTDLPVGTPVAYGGEGTGHGELIVTGRQLVARLPEGLAFADASFATLGAIAMNATRIAGLGLGDVVAVIGLGLVGQLTAQLARAQGARVIAIDLVPDRVRQALTLGAEHGIASTDATTEEVLSLTAGRGVDCAFICAAAKSAGPSELALALTRDRGRIVVVGAVDLHFPWLEMYLKEITLNMARAYGPGSYDAAYERQGVDYPLAYVRWTENRNMEEFLRLVSEGVVKTAPLISHRYPLEDAAQGYATIMDPAVRSLAVVLEYPPVTLQDPPVTPARRMAVAPVTPGQRDIARFALVGAGNIVRWAHMPSLKAAHGAVLHAVFSSNGVRAKSYASRYGAAYCTTDYEEVLRDPTIDAVLIASRNQQHAPQALAALRAGKHVFVEKPMALTEAECESLAVAQRESGRVCAIGFNRRFAPFYAALRERLRRRTGPAVLQCRVNSPGISGGFWMADPAIGGALLGEAVHFVDLLFWMVGAEPTSVSAFMLPEGEGEPVGMNNLAATFRFADDSIATLTYCTVGHKGGGGERVEAFATGISAMSENFTRLTIAGALPPSRRRMFADKGYTEQMTSFVNAVRGSAPHPVDVRDGARATIGCLRLLESARNGGAPRSIDLGPQYG